MCAAGWMSHWNTADATALQVEREIAAALVPQPVRQAMRLDGMEALVVEDRLEQPMVAGSRSTVAAISARKLSPIDGVSFECIGIGLPDQLPGQRGMVEPFRQPIDNRASSAS